MTEPIGIPGPNALEATPPSRLLFTYGTLLLTTGIPAVDEAMRGAGTFVGRAYVHGWLYDLGDYPGAVAVPVADGEPDEDAPKVWGHLLRLADPAALFAVLDPYEGYDPADLEASEFARATAPVTLAADGAVLPAQIYWYRFPVAGRAVLAGGDYLAHRAASCRSRGSLPF